MNYTDQQLQLALAKMLPDMLAIEPVTLTNGESYVRWCYNSLLNHPSRRLSLKVLDTEWLHVCWLVEETILASQQYAYMEKLASIAGECDCFETDASHAFRVGHATWQQRAIALAKVKGLEI